MGRTAKLETTHDNSNDLEVLDEPKEELLEEVEDDSAEDEIFAKDDNVKNLDATQLYLGEIGFSPLLSAEEEVYFARKALRGCEAFP